MGLEKFSELQIGYSRKFAYNAFSARVAREEGANLPNYTDVVEITIPEADSISLLQRDENNFHRPYDWALEELRKSGREDNILNSYGKSKAVVTVNLGINAFEVVNFSFEMLGGVWGYTQFAVVSQDGNTMKYVSNLGMAKEFAVRLSTSRDRIHQIWGSIDRTPIKQLVETVATVVETTRQNVDLRLYAEKFTKIWTTYVYWFCGWSENK